ncbi:MAG TPA: flagellar assembly protein FliX [Alphaproteobacteria bacterium]|nr:flagellar assembly protein FliX [Alphaproteobacteria bacterium]USO04661.1 MAG: flagellar assembly protein FliX [Rhodospirillales bacterium]HOO82282.1 flagellar assembly protein FliX [Alphaproteobacteria bacterium]
MKVQGPGGAKGPSKTGKSGKTSKSDASFGDFIAKDTPAAATTQNTQSIAQVDALLAIQGAEDPTQGAARKRARKRSGVILDELEKIRMAMLGGTLTVGHMIDIADVVASHREKIMDPALTDIMDEIDLRAQVELAKMRVALDARN